MAAVIGSGTQLHLTNGSSVLTQITGLISVNRPNLTVNEVDAMNHASNAVEAAIPGTINPGSFSATVELDPNDTIDQLLVEHITSRETRAAKIVEVASDGSTEDVTFNVFLTAYETDDAPIGERRTVTVTGRATALYTVAASA